MGRPKGSKNKPKYGTSRTLTEVLQELVTYVRTNTAGDVNLELTVPQALLEQESYKYQQPGDVALPVLLAKLHLTGGTVTLNPSEPVSEQVAV